MNTLLIVLSTIVGVLGLSMSIWSFFDTRKKYYNNFIQERKNRGKIK
jgi:hypothetical protein